MARPPYSVRLFTGFLITTAEPLITGDGINTYVIRDIQCSSSLPSDLYPQWQQGFRIYGAAGVSIFEVRPPFSRNRRSYQWQGRYILSPGETVYGETDDTAAWGLAISGYKLTPT